MLVTFRLQNNIKLNLCECQSPAPFSIILSFQRLPYFFAYKELLEQMPFVVSSHSDHLFKFNDSDRCYQSSALIEMKLLTEVQLLARSAKLPKYSACVDDHRRFHLVSTTTIAFHNILANRRLKLIIIQLLIRLRVGPRALLLL